MKIKFLKTITVDVEKTRLNEVWDKTFNRWEEVKVDEIIYNPGNSATLKTYEGDFILYVPIDSFEEVKEKRNEFNF